MGSLRGRLASWARTTGLTSEAVDDVVLACYEALANAAEHAYRGRPGEIRLNAERIDDHVIVTVTDRGRWLVRGAPETRGRGLLLMRELADDAHFTVDLEHPGTTVRLRWRLGEPARDGHDGSPGP